MIRKGRVNFIVLLFAALAGLPLCAAPLKRQPASRLILHLYDGKDRNFLQSNTHELAQVVFDHLGLILIPHDIRQGLPTHEDMRTYRGVFIWPTEWQLEKPERFLNWLREEGEQGRYVVVWGSLGAYINAKGEPTDPGALRNLYKSWGFDSDGNVHVNRTDMKIDTISPVMYGFERPMRIGFSSFVKCKPVKTKRIDVYLSLKEGSNEHPPSPVSVRHPYGGFILDGYIFHHDWRDYKKKWLINPFRYLRECFRLKDLPAVDLTTLNGCRMFYSHIDGDGSIMLSKINQKKICAEITYEKILKKYPLPITASVVEGEVIKSETVPWLKDRERIVNAFKEIYKLDNIEAGSHGCTHPMHWDKGVTGLAIEGISRPATNETERKLLESVHYENSAFFTLSKPEWLQRELIDSVNYVDTLVPEGKRCSIFLWTGNCQPCKKALGLLEENSILNINAGDPMFDALHPSYTSVSPAYQINGNYVQYYTSASNETIYTNTFTTNFSGLRNVIKTFKHTNHPRRIKPINIYYHYYSVERHASYNALKDVYDYAMTQDIAPLFTSEYVKLVGNSLNIKLYKQGNMWSWENARECRTLRWDTTTDIPDLTDSKGVIGYFIDPLLDCIYLHLDGTGDGYITLKPTVINPTYISRATGYIGEFKRQGTAIRFVFNGHGNSWIEFSNCKPDSRYNLWVGVDKQTVTSNTKGRLMITLANNAFNKHADIKLEPETIE